MPAEDRTEAIQAEEKGMVEIDGASSHDGAKSSSSAVETTAESPVGEGNTDQSRVLPPKELAWVFLGLCLVLFMASLDQTIVSVLIPTLSKHFDAPQQLAWVGTAYLLTNTAMQPLYGKLSDIFGRKNVILMAIFFFLVGSVICGAANDIIVLIIGRGIAGIGAGGMISLTMIIISDVVSLRERGKYQGIIGSMFGLSAVIGPLLGGVLAEKSSFRWAFYLNLPIGFVSTIALLFILRLPKVSGTNRDKIRRVDFLGAFTCIVGIICVLLSTNWGGNEYAWDSVQVIVPYCVGAVFLAAFLYIEGNVAVEPIMPFRLFRNRSVCATFATSFFIGGGFMGIIFYVPLYFQMVMHYSATKAGLQLLPMVAGMLIGGIGSGVLISKTGIYRPYIWVALTVFTVGLGLISLWDETSGLGKQIGFLIVTGAGLGGCMQTVVLAGQVAVANPDIATVTSMLSFFRTMGGVVNVAIGGTMINNILKNNGIDPNNFAIIFANPAKYSTATQAIFRQCIAWPAVALLAALFIEHYELKKTVGPEDPKGKASGDKEEIVDIESAKGDKQEVVDTEPVASK